MGIGRNLAEIRKQQGLSQVTLSKNTGLSQQYISRIEQDKPVTLDTLTKYALVLGCNIVLQNLNGADTPNYFIDRYINRKFMELQRQGEPILSHIAAAEALGLFSGFVNNYPVDYYSETELVADNTIWHKFTHNEFGSCIAGGIRCTGVNQTINDLLSEYDSIDEVVVLEALSTYYYRNNKSYDGLKVYDQNADIFESLSRDAILY